MIQRTVENRITLSTVEVFDNDELMEHYPHYPTIIDIAIEESLTMHHDVRATSQLMFRHINSLNF